MRNRQFHRPAWTRGPRHKRDLIDHFEATLGRLDAGWHEDPDGIPMGFQIARFPQCRFGTAFATLGLSRHALHVPETGVGIRLELLMVVPHSLADGPVPGVMQQVADQVLAEHHALLRGDVLGPRGQVLPGSNLEGLYVTWPAYFPEQFAQCQEDDYTVTLAWLVPVSRSEISYVRSAGWQAFEAAIVEQDPDLIDVSRAPLVLDS